MKSLIALADTGSLRRAAERVHLSPAAVHRQLKLLSEELGIQIYEGTRRQIHLTPAGSALCPMVRTLLAQYEEILSAAGQWRQVKRGSVRIGTGPTFGTYVLPEILESFRDRFPDVEVFVVAGHSDHLTKELAAGHLDLIFLVPPHPLPAELSMELSWNFQLVLVGSPRSSLPRVCSFSDLQDEPFLLYQHGTYFETLIDAYFARHEFTPRVTMRFDNAEPIKAMMRIRLGVSLLPVWTVEDELKARTLRLIRQREEPLTARLAVLRRGSAALSPPIQAFLDAVRSWQAAPGDQGRKVRKTK